MKQEFDKPDDTLIQEFLDKTNDTLIQEFLDKTNDTLIQEFLDKPLEKVEEGVPMATIDGSFKKLVIYSDHFRIYL